MHPLNAELNPICHLLALLGGASIVVLSRLKVNYAVKQINSADDTRVNECGAVLPLMNMSSRRGERQPYIFCNR